jgi:hypothetical protein
MIKGLERNVPINPSTMWEVAYKEIFDEANRLDFVLLALSNDACMSSLKTHISYGYHCEPDGHDGFFVRFVGQSKWEMLL